jgi:RNA polymerase sigma factor (sigma-70 family)
VVPLELRSGRVEPFGDAGRLVSVVPESWRARGSSSDALGEQDREPFEVFYRGHWLPTVRVARMILGSREEAEEVAQEALIRVHERWAVLDRPDAFLYTATVNLCRSSVRRRGLERRKRVADPIRVVNEPEIDDTWAALSSLPFGHRAVLVLRYYADLPEAEIAAILGCRVGTVKSARHRGLRTLRKDLS